MLKNHDSTTTTMPGCRQHSVLLFDGVHRLTFMFTVQNKEAGAELIALNPKKKISFKLAEKHELSHNVRRLRFALQTPEHRTGLPVGQHMFFYAKVSSSSSMPDHEAAACLPSSTAAVRLLPLALCAAE